MNNPITKIVNKLSRTKLGYTKLNLKEEGKCAYCAEGVLLKGLVPEELFEGKASINSVILTYPSYRDRIYKKYGIDFGKDYQEEIDCPVQEEGCRCSISSFNHLVFHISDYHSESHKQTAQILKQLDKDFDLLTGAKR